MNDWRKLLVLGLNAALKVGKIDPNNSPTVAPTDEDGYVETTIAGYPSVILWSSISHGELRISVWWNYDHSKHPQADGVGSQRETFDLTQPLANEIHYRKFVGATVSGWFERKSGNYIQGKGKQGIFDTYLRRDMKDILKALPDPVPEGFKAEGAFYR